MSGLVFGRVGGFVNGWVVVTVKNNLAQNFGIAWAELGKMYQTMFDLKKEGV